jgi:hypothetical protein
LDGSGFSESSSQIIAAILAVVAIAAAYLSFRRRMPDTERERQRRLTINRYGRMTDGYVTEFIDGVIHYSYTAGGLGYFTTQDVSMLPSMMALEFSEVLGPATIKYDPKNPANSIIACEGWSGVEFTKRKTEEKK